MLVEVWTTTILINDKSYIYKSEKLLHLPHFSELHRDFIAMSEDDTILLYADPKLKAFMFDENKYININASIVSYEKSYTMHIDDQLARKLRARNSKLGIAFHTIDN